MKTFSIRLFLLSFCLLTISCSTEDNIISSTKATETNGITARFISSDELDKIISDKLNTTNQQSNAAAKLAFSKKYNFNIDTKQVLMIEKGNYKSFSFPVYRDVTNDVTENLFLHQYQGGYLAYLMQYKFTKEDLKNLQTGSPIDNLMSKIIIKPFKELDINIDYNIGNNNYTTNGDSHIVMIDGKCYRYDDVVIYQDGSVDYSLVAVPCTNVPGSVGGSPSSPGSGITLQQYLAIVDLSGGSMGGTGTVGGGSWSSIPSIFNPNPVKNEDTDSPYYHSNVLPIIGIVHPLYTNLERYTNTLSDGNKEFWNKSQSSKIVKNIQEYLKTHPLSNNLKQILDQLLDEARLTGATYDIEKSVASPANIDFSAVSGTSANEQRLNAIYNIVSSSPLFKKMITNMFGSSERYNVKFKIGPTGNANGTTIPAPSGSTVTNSVTLNPGFLAEGSTVSIATTIIHEMIHAYLNVLRLRGGVDPSIIASDDLAACIHNYYKNDLANEAGQHNFMAQNFGPVITQMLLEIKNSIFTAAEIHKVEHPEVYGGNYILYAPTSTFPASNSGIATPWIWNDFFVFQSYEGLQSPQSNTIYDLFPQGPIQYYYFERYNLIAILAFGN